MKALVICLGNPIRSDDALGWGIADKISDDVPSEEVEVIKVHQIVPELAEEAAHADLLVLVDSSMSGTEVTELQPGRSDLTRSTHSFAPQDLLNMILETYGRCPKAFLVGVGGSNFSVGSMLSPYAKKEEEKAVRLVLDLLGKEGHLPVE